MYAVKTVGRYTGIAQYSQPFATRAEAAKLMAKCEKHVGNATLSRTIVTM